MKWPKDILAQYIIQICHAKGVKHIVLSPGSRNAPLTLGFTNHHSFRCYSIVDERSAAFFALGIAQQIQEPVAVVCTSGSALLNYYPAVAEAFYSGLPLVVISADRPAHLIGVGDGQTIVQPHAFGNHVLFEANLLPPKKSFFQSEKSYRKKLQNKITRALEVAQSQMGPVHINVPFEEPLYETVVTPTKLLESKFSIEPKKEIFSLKINTSVFKTWRKAKKKLILVGVNPPNVLESIFIEKLAQDPSVIVLTETTSNLHHPNFFPSIDQLIDPLKNKEFEMLQPDILLTFGGLIISKKIKKFLRSYQPNIHWHVDPYRANDTFFSLTKHFKCDSNHFFSQLLEPFEPTQSHYFTVWNEVKLSRLRQHREFLQNMPFSDFKAFQLISQAIPNNVSVHSSNSSAIRYLQLFEFHPSVYLYCNRGTSGIDGSSSTAVGSANISKRPTLLITGDLSFFYDINAFWNDYVPDNFKIILINNKGGGIFRILPGNDNSKIFETYFETKHNRSAKSVAESYSMGYFQANSIETLEQTLEMFFKPNKGPQLLEIFTPSNENDQVLRSYFEALK